MPPEILTTEQLAERLKTNPETIRRLARAGSLPALRVGSEYRYDWAAVYAAACPDVTPALVETLRSARDWIDGCGAQHGVAQILEEIDQALAFAEGRP